MFLAVGLHYMGIKTTDRLYCPLPLYHTAGGVISVGQAILMGCTVIIKTKFSASQYFPDCVKYKATVSKHIYDDTYLRIRVVFLVYVIVSDIHLRLHNIALSSRKWS